MTRYQPGSRRKARTHAELKAYVEAKRQARKAIPIRPIPVEVRHENQRQH